MTTTVEDFMNFPLGKGGADLKSNCHDSFHDWSYIVKNHFVSVDLDYLFLFLHGMN